jgi:hypothetical protein
MRINRKGTFIISVKSEFDNAVDPLVLIQKMYNHAYGRWENNFLMKPTSMYTPNEEFLVEELIRRFGKSNNRSFRNVPLNVQAGDNEYVFMLAIPYEGFYCPDRYSL